MREIKFRAWDNIQQKMINNTYGVFDLLAKSENIVPMPYTGLKDRHGKEIYEVDILEYVDNQGKGYGPKGEVVFQGGAYRVKRFKELEAEWLNKTYLYHYTKKHQVIGDIYSNPEFLN